jgi:hypothetical protein
MKKFTLCGALCLLILTSFSQVTCPSFFKVNNGSCGNGAGTSQMQLYWNAGCPSDPLPVIDSVYYNGANLHITFMAPDGSQCAQHNFIGYCITSGNIPPATHLQIFMNFGDSTGGGGHGSGTINCDVVAGGPLPIIISGFWTNRSSNHVQVLWKTAQETDVANYEIQRSLDNMTFQSIGTLACRNAPDNVITTYSFTDENTSKNVTYYRVKVNDVHGRFTYTDTKAVIGMKASGEVVIYPNPVTSGSVINIYPMFAQSTVEIVDNSGRLVQSTSLQNSSKLQLNNITRGMYIVRITNKETGEILVKKITVAD